MYEYKCQLLRVVDGDTIEAVIDLGFDIHFKSSVRLFGINAPEPKGVTYEAAMKSKARLTELVTGKLLTIKTYKKEKDTFKRVLGTVFADGVDVCDKLLVEGLAVVYKEN